MSWVQRYLKGFRVQEDLSPGLFERPDGSTWVRLPDGSAVQLPGGGSQSLIVASLSVAFDTPNLENGVAIPGYVPKAGDIISTDTSIQHDQWDGTTPTLDLFFGSGATVGYYKGVTSSPVFLNVAVSTPGANVANPTAIYYQAYVDADVDEVLVVVSQDGTKGGAAPGGTTGTATVQLIVIRP